MTTFYDALGTVMQWYDKTESYALDLMAVVADL